MASTYEYFMKTLAEKDYRTLFLLAVSQGGFSLFAYLERRKKIKRC